MAIAHPCHQQAIEVGIHRHQTLRPGRLVAPLDLIKGTGDVALVNPEHALHLAQKLHLRRLDRAVRQRRRYRRTEGQHPLRVAPKRARKRVEPNGRTVMDQARPGRLKVIPKLLLVHSHKLGTRCDLIDDTLRLLAIDGAVRRSTEHHCLHKPTAELFDLRTVATRKLVDLSHGLS